MASRVSRFENDFDPTSLLTSLFGDPLVSSEGSRPLKTWKTPYGCSFVDVGMGSDMWMYEYHNDMLFVTEGNKGGMLSGADIKRVLEVFQVDQNALRQVPNSVKKLAKEVGGQVSRHPMGFGKWAVRVEGKISAFCNPFGLSLGYTSSADDFEVLFMEKEEEPREEQTIEEIVQVAKMYGYVQEGEKPKICVECGEEGKFKCGRCKKERYCSRECQQKHWRYHSKECK